MKETEPKHLKKSRYRQRSKQRGERDSRNHNLGKKTTGNEAIYRYTQIVGTKLTSKYIHSLMCFFLIKNACKAWDIV